MQRFGVFSIACMLLLGSSLSGAADRKGNDPSIGELPDVSQSLRLFDYTEAVANMMVFNSLSYKAFLETFHIRPRVDMVFVTKVRDDVTRYRLVGKDYNGDTLLGCVEWSASHHQPKPGSEYLESYAIKISKTDCRQYEQWEKFIDLRK